MVVMMTTMINSKCNEDECEDEDRNDDDHDHNVGVQDDDRKIRGSAKPGRRT